MTEHQPPVVVLNSQTVETFISSLPSKESIIQRLSELDAERKQLTKLLRIANSQARPRRGPLT